jgi:hypothetical protein
LAIDLGTALGVLLCLTNKSPITDLEAEGAEGLRALDGWCVFHAMVNGVSTGS